MEFHTSYKYLIYAKSQKFYKELGNIVANHEKEPIEKMHNKQQLKLILLLDIDNLLKSIK